MVKTGEMPTPRAFTAQVAARVAAELRLRGITQTSLARELGRSQGYVWQRWQGHSGWNTDELDLIATRYLGFASALHMLAALLPPTR